MTLRKTLACLMILLLAGFASWQEIGAAGPPPPSPMQVIDEEGVDEEQRVGVYRGTVTDRRKGKPILGAVVVFLNDDTGESYQASTGKDGRYEIELPAGEYIVDIQVGKKVYRSTGSFREEADGKRWVINFAVGSKLTEKDLKISTTPRAVRLIPTEPRPPLEPNRKMMEFWIFLGGIIGVAALAN